jgi:hypothetical protein
MKKTTHLKIVTALAMSIVAGTTHATNVSLLNTYNHNSIMFKVSSPGVASKERTLQYNERTMTRASDPLGNIDNIPGLSWKNLNEYRDLGYILTKIKAEKNSHSNADVIIEVYGPTNDEDWGIRLFWAEK